MNSSHEVRIILPPKTIITLVLTALSLGVLYQVRDILTLFLVVIAIVVSFSPIIRIWERYIPRTLAIILLYILIILLFVIVSALILPIFISQLRDFLLFLQSSATTYGLTSGDILSRLHDVDGTRAIGQIFLQFQGNLGKVYSTTLGVVGALIAFFTVFMSSFYLLLEEKNFQQFLNSLIPMVHHRRVNTIFDRISDKMGSYLRGQALLMISIGLIDGIAMAIIGLPYALLLGLWAGIMELLPYVGPILGALPGVFLAANLFGVGKALIAAGIYFVVQQLENQFLVPRIMGRALGLSPVVIIFSLLIGGKLLGFIGLVIAIPIAAALSVIFNEWRETNEEDEETTKTAPA